VGGFCFEGGKMDEQILREIIGPVFYAMLSLYDRAAERESVQLLRDTLASGGLSTETARRVLQSIVDASEPA
jgi:chorismate mutase